MPQQINPNQPYPESITAIVGSYGVPFNGVMMNRRAAEHYAEQMVGTAISQNLYPSHQKFQIVACYLEDLDGPDIGQIIAVCKSWNGQTGPGGGVKLQQITFNLPCAPCELQGRFDEIMSYRGMKRWVKLPERISTGPYRTWECDYGHIHVDDSQPTEQQVWISPGYSVSPSTIEMLRRRVDKETP